MLKKIGITAFVLLSVILLSSCSSILSLTGGFGDMELIRELSFGQGSFVTVDSFMKDNPVLYPDDEFTLGACKNPSDSGYVVVTDYVVEYDPELLDFAGENAADKVDEFLEENKYSVPEGRALAVVEGDVLYAGFIVKSVISEDGSASTMTTIRAMALSNAVSCSNWADVQVNVATISKVARMAEDESTRLYMAMLDPMMITRYSLYTRGIVDDDFTRITFSCSNLNSVMHDYKISVVPLNYEDNVLCGFLDYKRDFVYTEELTTSNDLEFEFCVKPYQSLYQSEEFLRGDGLELQVQIYDKTDSVIYFADFEVPFESFDNALSGVVEIKAATNGKEKAGALVETDVWVDAELEAYSVDDRFSYVMLVIYDPAGEKVFDNMINLANTNNGALSGSLSGWGKDVFSSRKFVFVPKTTGTYNVVVYTYDSYGYNLNRFIGTIDVVQ